jgi:hypothetical protein
MPVEGQWERVNGPLRSNDRTVLVVMACLTAVVLIGAVIYALTKPRHSDAGCVVFTVPASVGGATVRDCGAKGKAFCATKDGQTEAAAECRRLGYPSG